MERHAPLPWWFFVANWVLVAAALWLGVKLGERMASPAGVVAALPRAELEALAIVHRQIVASHVDPQDPAELLQRAIDGMVRSLDPYSRYVPPREAAQYTERNSGTYVGIGADFRTFGDEVVLMFPLAGGAAERAGLQPGDVLLAVDDVALTTPELRARIAERVRGASGTTVRLRLRRGEAELAVALARGEVHRPCVAWAHRLPGEDGLGYVCLGDFQPDAADEVLAAIDALQQDGPLRGLALDLRGNGGGSLAACVALARAFVPDGLIVTQTRRDTEIVERFEAKADACRFPSLALTLLVDEGSASASEVLAGALQDHGRAAIVGERTHGKGCVNTVYTWQDRPFQLKLTTGRYRTPAGRDIERRMGRDDAGGDEAKASAVGGIVPDVAVGMTEAERQAARGALRAIAPPAAHRAAYEQLAQRLGLPAPTPPRAGDDPQLAAAVATLRARAAGPK
ncbi:MAG: S41 family peptidase [Planctomycetota bacterium]|jgi:carboxyl-terminal processing protease